MTEIPFSLFSRSREIESSYSWSFEPILVPGVCAFRGWRFKGRRVPWNPAEEGPGSGKYNSICICSLTLYIYLSNISNVAGNTLYRLRVKGRNRVTLNSGFQGKEPRLPFWLIQNSLWSRDKQWRRDSVSFYLDLGHQICSSSGYKRYLSP